MTNAPPVAGFFNYNAAAMHLGVSRKTLERAVANRASGIPYIRDPLTGRVRFPRDELDKWWRGRGRKR